MSFLAFFSCAVLVCWCRLSSKTVGQSVRQSVFGVVWALFSGEREISAIRSIDALM